MKMVISVGRCLKRKTMLVCRKEYIIKNFTTCKSLFNLQELYTTFKEKHQNVNIGFSKFCALRPKWCVLASSKFGSLCLRLYRKSKCCVASWCNGLGFDIQRMIKKIICNTESNKCIMYLRESCPGTATLNEFLD